MPIRALSTPPWMLALASICAAAAACYVPEPLRGAPCVDSAHCPSDQQCIAGTCGGTADSMSPVDASGNGGRDAGTSDAPPGDASGAVGCQSTDACFTALALGTVSGDTGAQTLTATGSRAAWFRIRVTENDADVAGVPLTLLATLTPPSSADFTVVLYANPAADVLECASPIGAAAATPTAKQSRASWGEDVVANGTDDSRTVSIEIRPLGGTCSATAKWTLLLEGNRS
jgi:hypothetical protein